MKFVKNDFNCEHIETILDGMSVICKSCGLVINDENLVSNFPRVYNGVGSDKRQHEVLDPFGISKTVIRVGKRELDVNVKPSFQRIIKKDRWYSYTAERKVQNLKILVMGFLTNNGIDNKNISRSANRYILKTKLINLQGSSLECYVSAILMYVFRECKMPFGVKKITAYFDVKKYSLVFKLFRRIIKEYKLPNLPPLQLYNYIRYYVNKVSNICGFNGKVSMVLWKGCLDFMGKLKDSNMCGRNKLCDTAGIIYYVSKNNNLGITQDVISDILSVSSASLRNVFKKIKNLKYDD